MYRVFAIASDIPRLGPAPLETLRGQLDYLRRHGVQAELILDPDPAELEHRLRAERPHCTYMLPLRRPGAEQEDDAIFAEHTRVTRLLQHLGLDFVGQDYQSQLTMDDKMLAAHISGMHPPGWLLTRASMSHDQGRASIDAVSPDAFPLIIKPNTLWASKGLGPESVCASPGAANARASHLFERFPGLEEIRLEKYLGDAREFTVTVMGNGGRFITAATSFVHDGPRHMIFSETEKTAAPSDRRLSYAPLDLRAPEFAELESSALALFDRFAFRDVARFDMLWSDKLYVVDVNHMPSLGRAMCCAWAASDGLNVEQLLALLLVSFDQRCGVLPGAERLPLNVRSSLPTALVSPLINGASA